MDEYTWCDIHEWCTHSMVGYNVYTLGVPKQLCREVKLWNIIHISSCIFVIVSTQDCMCTGVKCFRRGHQGVAHNTVRATFPRETDLVLFVAAAAADSPVER